jgi:hypothetical protein
LLRGPGSDRLGPRLTERNKMTDYEKKYFTQLTEVIETIQKALFKIDERLKELEKYAPNGVQYD